MIIPPKIYKFQSCNDYSLCNLQQQCIWFSRPETFNDPYDCDINFKIIDSTDANLRSMLSRMRIDRFVNNDEAIEMARKATEDIKKKKWANIRVACFTEEYKNILMWSHYANFHKGFCLEFSTDFYPFKPFKTQTMLKISYSAEYPSLSIKDIPHKLPSLPKRLLGTKYSDWEYENEWRIFSTEPKYFYDKPALTGVYFGQKMSDENKHKIMSILANSSTVFFEMRRSDSEFALYAKEISRA